MTAHLNHHHLGFKTLFLVISLFVNHWSEAAPVPLSIKSAVYDNKTASLTVKTQMNSAGNGLLSLIHGSGGVLGQTNESVHIFTISLAQLGNIPCQVEARLGDSIVVKDVVGASSECSKAPVCKITKPSNNASLKFNQVTHFEGMTTLKDKKAGPLTYEWDFAGGVMGHPSGKLLKSAKVKADATFIRNNSRYRVRFAAIDALARRCEASLWVTVGTPPALAELPDAAALSDMVETSQTHAPAKGGAIQKQAGEKVVLPFQDWTMQTATDARTVPDAYVVYGPQVNNINATVYEKARLPAVLDKKKIKLKYYAAVNPADPVGSNSINSTSQNWPVGKTLMEATIQKSDYFEISAETANSSTQNYSFTGFMTPELITMADEGYRKPLLESSSNPSHGLFMPGIASPYAANDPQSFGDYVEADNLFAAHMLPLTDIDDSGRVNPVPLFRIEARDLSNSGSISATDIVVNSGRDLHCRECHAKGKIGSNPNRPYKFPETNHNHAGGAHRALNFFEPDSDSIFDQEYAAIRNIANLHNYEGQHTGEGIWKWMELHEGGAGGSDYLINGPRGCNNGGCHTTALTRTPYQLPILETGAFMNRGGPLSVDMHNFHGKLQYKNANKDDIVRSSNGLPPPRKGLETKWDPLTGSMPDSLFPVKDKNGKILPMEENCLKCHGGMREQCYRDRMYTAGVTCYQCHGDMLAVGNSFKKSTPSADGNTFRQPWIDEPDCGSCHTGNANQDKKNTAGFFSAGVMKTAFDESDRSATPRQPDLSNPDQSRFAVPMAAMDIGDSISSDVYGSQPFTTKTPLYRAGKDNHGQVACAACHGAAHAIWPNRDPNANDNVTALQLQGHSGPIAECSVCHTADAFAKFDDIDEGLKASNPKIGVLGGPHNMHPVNDANWWKEAVGDKVDSTPDLPYRADGVIKGGWHNDYAKIAGKAGEDQCAACHGHDHLGTRLSKTPIDREFVNENGQAIHVKAGTEIGCDLCHSVLKSCTGAPSQNKCGISSNQTTAATNLPPIIQSEPPGELSLGDDYLYAVAATDLEGGQLSYQFVNPYSSYLLAINSVTGVIKIPSSEIEHLVNNRNISPPADLTEFQVMVSDNQGGRTLQTVRVTVNCPVGKILNNVSRLCVKLIITSDIPFGMLEVGQSYSYQVTAKQRSGEPLIYTLTGQPEGMNIDANGLITWKVAGNSPGLSRIKFIVKVSNAQGDSVQQSANLGVCAAPLHKDQAGSLCVAN